MGFRFRKSIKILPGVRINLSKSGPSLSLGGGGATFNVGGRGTRLTLGIPGTGIYYTTQKSLSKKDKWVEKDRKLDLGFFDKMTLSDAEKAFVEGVRALSEGEEALNKLRESASLPDGAFFAGFVALHQNQLEEALNFMLEARKNQDELGKLFEKYGLNADLSLPITEEIAAHVRPDAKGVALVLAEIYQALGQEQEALNTLQFLYEQSPDDVMVRLSIAELLLPNVGETETCQRILKLAEGIENETEIHTALLLYRAMALRGLGMVDVAKEALTAALRRKKDRSKELLLALRYELALCYESLGKVDAARKELQGIYAESPDYEDVASRLGL
ncbi:MAG: tetratricopeptide repeat protein [Anaerolineae bacterium]|nr:tetratricopeptide repeat protein [Anaerolineae bacterium]